MVPGLTTGSPPLTARTLALAPTAASLVQDEGRILEQSCGMNNETRFAICAGTQGGAALSRAPSTPRARCRLSDTGFLRCSSAAVAPHPTRQQRPDTEGRIPPKPSSVPLSLSTQCQYRRPGPSQHLLLRSSSRMAVDRTDSGRTQRTSESVARGGLPPPRTSSSAGRRTPPLAAAHSSPAAAHSLASTTVAEVDSTPPMPCATPTRAFSTCRWPDSPRSCRTAAISSRTPNAPG